LKQQQNQNQTNYFKKQLSRANNYSKDKLADSLLKGYPW